MFDNKTGGIRFLNIPRLYFSEYELDQVGVRYHPKGTKNLKITCTASKISWLHFGLEANIRLLILFWLLYTLKNLLGILHECKFLKCNQKSEPTLKSRAYNRNVRLLPRNFFFWAQLLPLFYIPCRLPVFSLFQN